MQLGRWWKQFGRHRVVSARGRQRWRKQLAAVGCMQLGCMQLVLELRCSHLLTALAPRDARPPPDRARRNGTALQHIHVASVPRCCERSTPSFEKGTADTPTYETAAYLRPSASGPMPKRAATEKDATSSVPTSDGCSSSGSADCCDRDGWTRHAYACASLHACYCNCLAA